MAAPQSFRTAFHGFNREDVVHYIEYITAKHNAQVGELNAEIEFLRGKLENHPMESVTPERLYEAELQRDEYKQQLEEQAARIRELEAGCARSGQDNSAALELAARCAALEKELSEALTARDSAQNRHTTQELEAYRRAERTERIARERAEQVYHKANGALADATARVDDAAIQISEMTDKVMEQLQLLQQAVAGSRKALTDAAVTMYSIRPNSAED